MIEITPLICQYLFLEELKSIEEGSLLLHVCCTAVNDHKEKMIKYAILNPKTHETIRDFWIKLPEENTFRIKLNKILKHIRVKIL